LIAVGELDERVVPILDIHWITPDFHRQGMARLFRENRRRLSLVDCVSMEFIESQGLRDVFGLDAHFAEAGCRLLQRSGRT
jgi:predicted nucleic acid-binding protein